MSRTKHHRCQRKNRCGKDFGGKRVGAAAFCIDRIDGMKRISNKLERAWWDREVRSAVLAFDPVLDSE